MTNRAVFASPRWSTASFGDSADMSPTELAALGKHVTLCKALSGPLFAAQCVADAVHRFLAARFVTTVVVVAVLIGISSFVL